MAVSASATGFWTTRMPGFSASKSSMICGEVLDRLRLELEEVQGGHAVGAAARAAAEGGQQRRAAPRRRGRATSVAVGLGVSHGASLRSGPVGASVLGVELDDGGCWGNWTGRPEADGASSRPVRMVSCVGPGQRRLAGPVAVRRPRDDAHAVAAVGVEPGQADAPDRVGDGRVGLRDREDGATPRRRRRRRARRCPGRCRRRARCGRCATSGRMPLAQGDPRRDPLARRRRRSR